MKVLWKSHSLLASTCFAMAALFLVNLTGIVFDSRLITGVPAWLKPTKFAISTAIYSGTLAWIVGRISVWPRFVKSMGTATAPMLLVEIFVINLQAWRGTTSHFNLSTKLDSALFGVMGLSIAVLWLASVGIAAALFRQQFSNRSFGWALRLGMLITVLGSASGGMMTRQMPGQTSRIIGSHTVGAPDGGAAIPVIGWSADHGDLRAAHFLGLHGMQAMLLVYWVLARRGRPGLGVIFASAAGYVSAAGILEWQALRGQSILHPDSLTAEAWAIWLVAVSALIVATHAKQPKGLAQSAAGLA